MPLWRKFCLYMHRLNLAFHKIKNNPSGKWEISPAFFEKIYDWCVNQTYDFHIYFDDGKNLDLPANILKKIAHKSTLAVETGNVGKTNYLTWQELQNLVKIGFSLASHTVSHPALCVYDKSNTNIISTPLGGEYTSSPRGRGQVLSEYQVRYQLIESKKKLTEKGFNVEELVFPYGLYSASIIGILDKLNIYKYYTTCDEEVYQGGKIIPRFLIYGDKTPEENISCLIKNIEKLI